MSLDRDAIIADNPLLPYCEARGWQLKRDGRRWKCLCPLHDERTPSFMIDAEKNLWNCFGCGKGGSVIDLHARLGGMTVGEAMRDLSREGGNDRHSGNGSSRPDCVRKQHRADLPPQKPSSEPDNRGEPQPRETAFYDYQDAIGQVVYQVVRYEPKAFKQCRIVDGGKKSLEYGRCRAPALPPARIAGASGLRLDRGGREGCRNLARHRADRHMQSGRCGQMAPGVLAVSARQMRLSRARQRRDRTKAHALGARVAGGLVEWVRWVELPREFNGSPVKDVSDLLAACKDADEFFLLLAELQKGSRLIERGIESRCRTMTELEADYIAGLSRLREVSLSLGNWLPGLGVRALGPGDLLGILADTGQMKSATVLNILAHNADLQAVVFSLELAGGKMFERGVAVAADIGADTIEGIYLAGQTANWRKSGRLRNLLVCPGVLTMEQINEEVVRSSAKFGCSPKVIAIDYAQLVRTPGNRSRYERMSDVCEEARILANRHHLVVILVSQIHRPRDDNGRANATREVTLHDAKDSGSFENSCSLILGQWKTSKTTMRCRVLKDSRGVSGKTIDMEVRGGTYIIDPAT